MSDLGMPELRRALGGIAPGTVRPLPLSVPDPQGGLPWGMRVLSTTRGVGCLQVGRLLDGRLVALGQDGAFGNDGRAHALPLSTNVERLNCSFVDGHGQIFDSITIKSQAASAAPGVHCEPPGTYAPSHHAAFSTCPLADERNLYYGMLGPDATGLTYSAGDTSHTIATVEPDEGASASYNGMIPQGRSIAAGQTLTKTLDQNRFGPHLAPGITTGSVILDYATGPLIQAEEDTAKIPVGTFKIRVP
jgi:hypothetical protein